MTQFNFKKEQFTNLSSTEIFDMFGGEMLRGNVSNVIRYLSSIGFTRGQIAKMLDRKYQHVRNVLTQPSKKN